MLKSCSGFGIFGVKIYAQYQIYGAQSGIADFWLVWDGGHPVGAVSRLDGTLTVAGDGEPEELAEFLSAVGGVRAELELPLAEAANAFLRAPLSASWILCGGRLSPPVSSVNSVDSVEIGPAAELRAVYGLLCRAQTGFAEAVRYDAWLAEMSHKVRHQLAKIFTLSVENEIISTTSILFQGDSRVILAGVATDPAFTGRGYGRRLVRYAVDCAMERGQVPYVLTEQDGLRRFYECCGFAPCGRWARLTLRGNGKESKA